MEPKVRLQVFDDPPIFFELQDAWLALLRQVGGTPFDTPLWMGVSFMYFFRQGHLQLYTLVDEETGKLVGVFPLAVLERNGYLWVTSPAERDVTDYVEVITGQQYRRRFLEEILTHLRGLALGRRMVLDLEGIRGTSPTLWTLKQLRESFPQMTLQEHLLTRAPYLNLPASYDKFLLSLKPKVRKQVARQVRRAEKLADLRFHRFSDPAQLREHLYEFFRLFVISSEEMRAFLTEERQAFYLEIAPLLAARGWLHLYMLEVDAEIASAALVLEYGATRYLYALAVNPWMDSDLSPGLVLLLRIVEQAIADGIQTLDLLRGDQAYKYLLGARDVPVYRVILGDEVPDLDPRPRGNLTQVPAL